MPVLAAVLQLSTLVSAGGLFHLGGDSQDVLPNDDLKIPGDSPLELCPKDHSDDIIQIESVDLLPNPPQAGKTLDITAVGTVREPIEEGAYVVLQVKYGVIRLISTKADLCEQIKNVDLECPIDQGRLSITKSVELPREIPPGKYPVLADVYSIDDKPITCLVATVVFSRGGGSGIFDIEL